ncbi:hypothetical protein Goari_027487, partial [Gossypium aridum]|nr:hypothetical protein [Gossypium aridum]
REKNTTGRDLAQNIQRHLAEFEGLKNLKKNASINRSHKTQEGIPRTRIYFDAAFDSRTFSSATGLVGWDLRGNLMVLKTTSQLSEPLSEIFRRRKQIFKNLFFSIFTDRRTHMLTD